MRPPSCSVCVSDCDGSAVITDCQHFICHRCVQRSAKGVCPRCQKPCRSVALNAPNAPRELLACLEFDAPRQLRLSLQALELQQRLETSNNQRLKEMVTMMNQQSRATAQQLGQVQQQLQQKAEECRTLQVEVNLLRDQLREVHLQGQQLAAVQQQQQRAVSTPVMSNVPSMTTSFLQNPSRDSPRSHPTASQSNALASVFSFNSGGRGGTPLPIRGCSEARSSIGPSGLPNPAATMWSPTGGNGGDVALGWSSGGQVPSKRARSEAGEHGGMRTESFHLTTPVMSLTSPQGQPPRHVIASSATRLGGDGHAGAPGPTSTSAQPMLGNRTAMLPRLPSLLPGGSGHMM